MCVCELNTISFIFDSNLVSKERLRFCFNVVSEYYFHFGLDKIMDGWILFML